MVGHSKKRRVIAVDCGVEHRITDCAEQSGNQTNGFLSIIQTSKVFAAPSSIHAMRVRRRTRKSCSLPEPRPQKVPATAAIRGG